jgi:hypothetical protein
LCASAALWRRLARAPSAWRRLASGESARVAREGTRAQSGCALAKLASALLLRAPGSAVDDAGGRPRPGLMRAGRWRRSGDRHCGGARARRDTGEARAPRATWDGSSRRRKLCALHHPGRERGHVRHHSVRTEASYALHVLEVCLARAIGAGSTKRARIGTEAIRARAACTRALRHGASVADTQPANRSCSSPRRRGAMRGARAGAQRSDESAHALCARGAGGLDEWHAFVSLDDGDERVGRCARACRTLRAPPSLVGVPWTHGAGSRLYKQGLLGGPLRSPLLPLPHTPLERSFC